MIALRFGRYNVAMKPNEAINSTLAFVGQRRASVPVRLRVPVPLSARSPYRWKLLPD